MQEIWDFHTRAEFPYGTSVVTQKYEIEICRFPSKENETSGLASCSLFLHSSSSPRCFRLQEYNEIHFIQKGLTVVALNKIMVNGGRIRKKGKQLSGDGSGGILPWALIPQMESHRGRLSHGFEPSISGYPSGKSYEPSAGTISYCGIS